jgi:soluble lytic murein transglycosylase-like protein
MRSAVLALAAAFTSSVSCAFGQDLACEREMLPAANKHGMPLGMLYAVGLTETGRGDSLQPYALNIEGRAVYDLDRRAALDRFRVAQQAGARSIDVGCMQINHRFHGQNFASIEEMLESAKNVDYAARFLRQLHEREGSRTMAVARYHAGPSNDPAQRRYSAA